MVRLGSVLSLGGSRAGPALTRVRARQVQQVHQVQRASGARPAPLARPDWLVLAWVALAWVALARPVLAWVALVSGAPGRPGPGPGPGPDTIRILGWPAVRLRRLRRPG
jgi:hypothetical protein